MRTISKKNGVTALLLAAFMLTGTGCAQNGYYSNTAPSGYYYSDPSICSTEKGICPLIIAAGIGGLVAVLAHH